MLYVLAEMTIRLVAHISGLQKSYMQTFYPGDWAEWSVTAGLHVSNSDWKTERFVHEK